MAIVVKGERGRGRERRKKKKRENERKKDAADFSMCVPSLH
jgi:hypothetical protein